MHIVYVWADMYKQFAGSAIKSVPISAMKYDNQNPLFHAKVGFSQKKLSSDMNAYGE